MMNKKYFFCRLSIFMMGVTLFLACEKVTDITLNKSELNIISGETEILIVTVYPDDVTNKKITWTSSNPAVVTINDKGLVTAIKDGEAIITVTTKSNKKTASCSVSVDYRNKWVGSYECEEIYHWWFISGESGFEIYQTRVDVTATGGSSLKFVENRRGGSYDAKVNSTGNFVNDAKNHNDTYVRGNFIDDSIKLVITPSHGLGSSRTSTYNGKNLNNK